MRNLVAFVVAAAAVIFLVFVIGAYAQEPGETVVSFNPFITAMMPYLEAIALAVITAAFGWIARKVHEWTGINVEAKHREALQSALWNGARTLAAKHAPNVELDVRNATLKEGIDFVLRSVPDAVKYFKLKPEDIARHLEPKVASLAVLSDAAAPLQPADK